ncbi:MAG: D-alanyl-D-alanine carboxypeptidase/D-alanyl-D-alanine-endopeptidase, partial [Propionibacteriaceae bacterium]
EEGYVGSVVAPVSPLWIDRGRVGAARSTEPAADAAGRFAELLRARGVDVAGEPARVEAPAGATKVAQARSARLSRIVERFLADSDNEVAEVLLRQAAIGGGQPGSFAGGAKVATEVLARSGVSTDGLVLNDGSGLSRKNRISATTLAETMVQASARPRLSSALSGLPVGGFSGTLENRYDRSDARGVVRAKTGTLTGVHSLAGIVTLSGGRPVAFAVMADDTEQVNPFVTQAALDRVAASMATCACGA